MKDSGWRAAVLMGAAFSCMVSGRAAAQAGTARDDHMTERPRAVAAERTESIVLDGVLSEGTWSAGLPASDFRQMEPREGEPATQRTEVRFAYDSEALYIGARMYDSAGAGGVRTRLMRRDQVEQTEEGDHLHLLLDTFHDHAGRTVFTVNPSGVKGDAGQASPFADPSWDPVWDYAARIDSLGWTAEVRIPWSQLRFSRDTAQSWGMQIVRYVERLGETSMWAFWTKEESGGPPRFGHLEGLRVRTRARGVEIMPYALTRASYVAPSQPGSPFQDASRYDARAGADVRMLMGSNLTLSATVNPDFGQVEQDPAVVNLTAFESFFEEKRPFFVEGSGLLSFGGFSCFMCGSVTPMNLFYSRRIGRAPQGNVPAEYEFSEVPRNTRLLGAAKLTGRTAGGWQLGVLDAVTAREEAQVLDTAGLRRRYPVEPLSNYFVARVRRTTGAGRATWGAMATSVIRGFGDNARPLRAQLPGRSEAIGIDWNLFLGAERTYRLMGNVALSSVSGDSLAISRLQRSSARYFQRPDRDGGGNGLFSDAYDTSARRLGGFGGYLRASRERGPWRWETAVNYRSPGFEVNDAAFNPRSDYVWMLANVLRQWTRPGPVFRSFTWVGGAQQQYNFDGDRTELQFHSQANGQLKNYWQVGLHGRFQPAALDDRMTRGGAVVRRSHNWFLVPEVSSDPRRRVSGTLRLTAGQFGDGSRLREVAPTVRVKPRTNVTVDFGAEYSEMTDEGQYVTQFSDATATAFFGRRAVFARLHQRIAAASARVNLTFTPELTLDLYAQPFASSGRFTHFQEYVRPRSGERRLFDAQQLTVGPPGHDGRPRGYTLDPDGNPATPGFEFHNPDFDVRSLRGNAVLRWEYRPGSTLFFVWQQERADPGARDEVGPGSLGEVFRQHPDNVFVIKASYWIGR